MSKPETTLAWGDWQQLDLSAPCRSPGEADPEGAPIYVDPNNSLLHPSQALRSQLSAGLWVWGVLQIELPDENPESLPTFLSTLGRRTSLAG